MGKWPEVDKYSGFSVFCLVLCWPYNSKYAQSGRTVGFIKWYNPPKTEFNSRMRQKQQLSTHISSGCWYSLMYVCRVLQLVCYLDDKTRVHHIMFGSHCGINNGTFCLCVNALHHLSPHHTEAPETTNKKPPYWRNEWKQSGELFCISIITGVCQGLEPLHWINDWELYVSMHVRLNPVFH